MSCDKGVMQHSFPLMLHNKVLIINSIDCISSDNDSMLLTLFQMSYDNDLMSHDIEVMCLNCVENKDICDSFKILKSKITHLSLSASQ